MRNQSDPGPYLVGGVVMFLALCGGLILAALWMGR